MVCGSYGSGKTGLSGPFTGGCRRGQTDGIDIVEFDLAYSNTDGFTKRTMIFLSFAMRSVGLAFSENYDVLFATTTPLTAGIPGIFARWLRRKPFVFEVRDLWPELPKAMGVIRNPLVLWTMSTLEWASYRSANRLIGLSPGIVDGIAKRGIARERIALIPNACDLDIFASHATRWRPKAVGRDDFMAVFTGTHGIANGLDAVLNAAGELQKRGREGIKIVLIGTGKLKPQLEERARKRGLFAQRGVPTAGRQNATQRPDGGQRYGPANTGQRPGLLLRHLAQQILRLHRLRPAGADQLSRLAGRNHYAAPMRLRRASRQSQRLRRRAGTCRRPPRRMQSDGRTRFHTAAGAKRIQPRRHGRAFCGLAGGGVILKYYHGFFSMHQSSFRRA